MNNEIIEKYNQKLPVNILAFETSCDETSVAVIKVLKKEGKNGDFPTFKILSNEIASQIEIHAKFGGVVPEIASRAHANIISPLSELALKNAKITVQDIDLVSVANRPGLIGALLIGTSFAKAFALGKNIPFVAVNHIMGHICAAYLDPPLSPVSVSAQEQEQTSAPISVSTQIQESKLTPPYVALVASGGHTSIILVSESERVILSRTRDDAAGEAFDKVARLLGAPYPGGAQMDAMAKDGDKNAIKFNIPIAGEADFSFSGLKTSAVNYIHNAEQKGEEINKNNIAAAFTKSAVDALILRLVQAIKKTGVKTAVIAGGVAANSHLREAAKIAAAQTGVNIIIPPKSLCGDNGAMIGVAGWFEYMKNGPSDMSTNSFATGRTESEIM